MNLALAVAAAAVGWWLADAWGLLLGTAVPLGEAAALTRTGRSPGHRLTGLRSVERVTGMPGTLGELLTRRCATADLRRGRDPLRLVPRPLPGPVPSPPPPPPPASTTGRAFALVADDGSRFVIALPTLVGRRAEDPSARYATVTIPDVSKTLSRNHALLEPTSEGLRVTDVGSSNGSAIAEPYRLHVIGKHQSLMVRAGARLLLGTRYFEVTYE